MRRGEILEAAERIFIEYGYEGATIRKIADEVGVSSTALYMHFRDKSEILLEICRTSFEDLMAQHIEIKALAEPPTVKVRHMLDAYMAFAFAHPNAYRLVFCARPQESHENEGTEAQMLGKRVFDSFAETVGELGATGRLKADTQVAAQVLWAGCHGVVALLITKPYFPWAERSALTGSMLDALFDGLVAA
ncbi:MAG TPA: TetR/AcrR family transcriptional regulator [Caulobacteraceae bacterium]|nr:TetR/AcrR family transcriptional regulator [Caulobacteraceae bacterium]